MKSVRLVLAFDAACGKCREISAAVDDAAGGRLEVLPLTHADVRRWRDEWFDGDAPWAPTLVRIDGDDVRGVDRAGHGVAAGAGPRPTVHRPGTARTRRVAHQPRARLVGAQAVLQAGRGVAVAGGMVFGGSSPAAAESAATKARAWVAANRGRLPERYSQLTSLPLAHRRAVFQASSTQVRTGFWLDHIDQFRLARPDLATRQTAIVDRARTLAPKALADGPHAHAAALTKLKEDAISKLGFTEARALLATLGPAEDKAAGQDRTPGTVADECECANFDPWCLSFLVCTNWPIGCSPTDGGCGDFWIWDCDGVCQFQT